MFSFLSWRNAGILALLAALGGGIYYGWGWVVGSPELSDAEATATPEEATAEAAGTLPGADEPGSSPNPAPAASGSGEPAVAPPTPEKVTETKAPVARPLLCDPSGSTTVRGGVPQVTTAVGTQLVSAGQAYLGIRGSKVTCTLGDDKVWTVRNDGATLTVADLPDDLLRKALKVDQEPIDSGKGWAVVGLLHGQSNGELAYYIE